jgi:hypothetical protein
MNSISVTYALKWRLRYNHKYQWSVCGKLFNVNTGKEKKKSFNNGSIGYWINRSFITLKNLRKELELIPKEKCPF